MLIVLKREKECNNDEIRRTLRIEVILKGSISYFDSSDVYLKDRTY